MENTNMPKSSKSNRSVFKRNKTTDRPEGLQEPADLPANFSPGADLNAQQMAQLMVAMQARGEQNSAALERPLRDLAQAFAMQAKVLEGVQNSQQTMQDSIANDTKAEMMLNSTAALNDTFRDVRRVQEGLVDRLSRQEKNVGRERWLWAFGAVVLTVAGVAIFYWVSSNQKDQQTYIDGRLSEVAAHNQIDQQKIVDKLTSERSQLQADLSVAHGKLARLSILEEQLILSQSREGVDRKEVDAIRKRERAASARAAHLERTLTAVQDELAETVKRKLAIQEQVDALTKIVVAEAKAGKVDWEKLSAKAGNSPNALAAIKRQKKEAANREEEPVAIKVDDEVRVKSVSERINMLLGRTTGSNVYKLSGLEAVKKDHLSGIEFAVTQPGRGVIKLVTADELRFVVSATGDMVELNFVDGHVQQRLPKGDMSKKSPFYNNRYRVTVFCRNGKQWLSVDEGFVAVD